VLKPPFELRILHEADSLLVVDKPPRLPTSGRDLNDPDCLQYWLIQRHGGMVWVAHQLDADTTGLNLFVTEKRLVDELRLKMAAPSARKRYLALVHGLPAWDERDLHAPIGKIDARSLGVHPDGKAARSAFRVLARGNNAALVEATIFTGRTHQIRIHLAHLGHPLFGEEWYVRPACTEHPRQALHAWRMELPGVSLYAPLPADLVALAARLGIDATAA